MIFFSKSDWLSPMKKIIESVAEGLILYLV